MASAATRASRIGYLPIAADAVSRRLCGAARKRPHRIDAAFRTFLALQDGLEPTTL